MQSSHTSVCCELYHRQVEDNVMTHSRLQRIYRQTEAPDSLRVGVVFAFFAETTH